MAKDNHDFRMLYLALDQMYNRKFKNKYNIYDKSFTIYSKQYKSGIIKGKSTNRSYIASSAKLEWKFYQTDEYDYIITKLTDYIFFLVPFSYFEFIYEIPHGIYNMNNIDNSILDIMDRLLYYKLDKYLYEDNTNSTIIINSINNVELYKLSEYNYKFIKQKIKP